MRSALDVRLNCTVPDNYMRRLRSREFGDAVARSREILPGAESEFRQALAIYDKSLPADHQYRASALMHFARLLVDRGKPDEALALSDQSLEIWNATSPASSPYAAQAHAIHAYALAHSVGRAKRPKNSTPHCRMLVKTRGADDPFVRRAQNWLKAALPTRQAATTAHCATAGASGAHPPRKIL